MEDTFCVSTIENYRNNVIENKGQVNGITGKGSRRNSIHKCVMCHTVPHRKLMQSIPMSSLGRGQYTVNKKSEAINASG